MQLKPIKVALRNVYKDLFNEKLTVCSYIMQIRKQRGGVERMEKMKLYADSFRNEENDVFQLEYFLLIRSAEQGKTYGVSIAMTDAEGTIEEDSVEGICKNREAAERFISRLAEGIALPVELAALCDDYISERESEKEYDLVQVS